MTTVLITGGSGRTGRSVVAGFAAAGHTVVSVDRGALPEDPALSGVVQESVDLLDAAAVHQVMASTGPTPSSTLPRSPSRSARRRT